VSETTFGVRLAQFPVQVAQIPIKSSVQIPSHPGLAVGDCGNVEQLILMELPTFFPNFASVKYIN